MKQESPERFCCDTKCFQRNASQGGSCPLNRHDAMPMKPSRAFDLLYCTAGVAILSALVFALVAPIQTGQIVAAILGIAG